MRWNNTEQGADVVAVSTVDGAMTSINVLIRTVMLRRYCDTATAISAS